MEEYNVLFDKYMKEFKASPTYVKRVELIDSVRDLYRTFEELCREDNIRFDFLKKHKALDSAEGFSDEDDYLDALTVCLESTKNIIAVYIDGHESNNY